MKNKKFLVILIITLFIFASFLVFYKVSIKDLPAKCIERAMTSGSCDKLLVGYQYDLLTRKCVEFRGGGCSGSVPFNAIETCQKTCE